LRGLLGSCFVWSIGHLGVEFDGMAGGAGAFGRSELCIGHWGGGRRDEEAMGGWSDGADVVSESVTRGPIWNRIVDYRRGWSKCSIWVLGVEQSNSRYNWNMTRSIGQSRLSYFNFLPPTRSKRNGLIRYYTPRLIWVASRPSMK